jgi:UDP-3-O-[3-hydroxymyristoyl] glucosamine N-acyltransferase
MEFSAKIIASMLGGEVVGNEEVMVSKVSRIEEGESGGLCFLANPKYEQYIYTTNASVVLVSKDFEPKEAISATQIKVEDPYSAFAALLKQYEQIMANPFQGIHESAFIDVTAKVGENVTIHPLAYVGHNAVIGNNCVLHSGAKVMHRCIIGNDCTLHAGVVIGGDGFGFAPNAANNYQKVPQIGNVVLEDNVEIGANATIDRATVGSTVIRKGVKLDNLVQIAHNVEIGENTVIAAQSGVAGSTKIGKNCMIGGQVGIVGHLKIGDGVMIAAQSGIGSDLKDGSIVQGSPAFEVSKYKRSYVSFRRLPELANEVDRISKELEKLTR